MSTAWLAFRKAVAEWWRQQPVAPAGEQGSWIIGRVNDNCHRIERLEAQIAAEREQFSTEISRLYVVMDLAVRAANVKHPDLEATMPQLRGIRGGRSAG